MAGIDLYEKYNIEPSSSKDNMPENESLLTKAGNLAGKFNQAVESTHLPAFAGGLYQGVGDVAASLGNLVARPLGHPIPHPEFKKYFDNSLGSNIAFGGGELASSLPLLATGAGAVEGLGLGAEAGLSGKVLQGLVSGSLLGENKEGGRVGGALTGAAMPLIGLAVKGYKAIRSKNIAKNVLEGMENAKAKSAEQFGNIFKAAEGKGVNKGFSAIDYNRPLLNKAGNRDYLHAMEEFKKNPTIENAHSAQSDLAKYANMIKNPVNKLERDAKQEALRASEEIRSKMMEQFHKTGNLKHGLEYNEARKDFAAKVGPYLSSKSIKALKSGNLRPKNFASRLAQEEDFMTKLGAEHPEVEWREKLKNSYHSPLGKAALIGIGGSLLPYSIYKYMHH